ncbi:MAG: c-type cytochrome [Gammaproteobacteria bacterium]
MNKTTIIFSLILLSTSFSAVAQNWPSVDLKATAFGSIQSARITIKKDPVYKGTKHYQGYPLTEIIKTLTLPEPYRDDDKVIVFTAKDGYRVAMAFDDALKEQGYLAYRDHDAAAGAEWTEFKFGKQKMTPAPFYLVWPKPGLDKWRYPWPFQLTKISLEPISVYFGAAAPKSPDADVRNGFSLFATYCIRCHSVNLAGGQVGPELNVPQNITEYFIEQALSGFILNAPAYRSGTKMPAFVDTLEPDQVRSIIHYLRHMKTEKIDAKKP